MKMRSQRTGKRVLTLMLLGFMILYYGCKKDDETIAISETPSIAAVIPGEGTIGTELTITGTNFMENAAVYIGEKASEQVEVFSSTVIYVRVPPGIPGPDILLSVRVQNPGGGEKTLNNAFKAIKPVLSFVNSATRPSGNTGSTVILEGKAFGDIKGEGEILFSDGAGGTIAATVDGIDDWTDEFIVTTVPGGAEDGPVVVKTGTGISNEIPFKVTTAATFSPSAIQWTETAPLPVAVSGHKALSITLEDIAGVPDQYVFVSGGRNADGDASDQVLAGLINSDGTITSWNNAGNLPAPRSFHASVAATPFNSKVDGSGYIFVLGGINSDGITVSDVSVAALDNDGALQAWAGTMALPEALHSAGAVIFRSAIYITGGADGDNSPVSKVYKSKINEDGTLDEWEALPELPSALAYHGFVSFGGYLYSVGGETGIAEPDQGSQNSGTKQIFYSRINLRTGEIGEWLENPGSIGKERSKHSTLILGGSLFISSGLYSGLTGNTGGSSENYYANINSDGTIGAINGATGSNTLFSITGNNLFNQSGTSYIDSDGVAHVLILGGAKVGSPATKLDRVLFY
jgi:hypothetical protein